MSYATTHHVTNRYNYGRSYNYWDSKTGYVDEEYGLWGKGMSFHVIEKIER